MKLKSFLACAGCAAMLFAAGCQKDEVKGGGGSTDAPELAVELLSQTLEKITFSVESDPGASVAWVFASTSEFESAWEGNVKAENIFAAANSVLTPEEWPATVDITEGIEPDVEYTLAVAASLDDNYSEVITRTILIEETNILSFVDATKTSFTYKVSAPDNQQWYHTYFEKPYFEEEVRPSIASSYPDYDEQQILQQALLDFGYTASGEQEITWTAGDDNSQRGDYQLANIVGGQSYIAVAATYSDGQFGKAETVEFSTPEPGESTATVSVEIKEQSEYEMITVITPDENVRFYFYALFSKELYDEAVALYGEEYFEAYLKNYGYISYNEYTDRWGFTEPGVEYVLLILGVDKNGDTFLHKEAITPPPVVPEVAVSVVPYDSETDGSWHGYESLYVQVHFNNFSEPVNPGSVYFGIYPKSDIESYGGIEWFMSNIAGMLNNYVMSLAMIYPDMAAELEESGYDFSGVLSNYNFGMSALTPDTEYYIVLAIFDPETYTVPNSAYALGRTNKAPAEGDNPDYQAYLGNWTLKGQSTETWTANSMTYNLRVEELVKNYSFKVYGWSGTSAGEEHPFIMNWNPDTKGVYVMAPQDLGPLSDDPDFSLVFGGLILYGVSDNLTFCYEDMSEIFSGSTYDDRLSLFGNMIEVQGNPYEYRSMNYMAVKNDLSDMERITGAEYDAIYFSITKDEASSAQSRMVPAGMVSRSASECGFAIGDYNYMPMWSYAGGSSDVPAAGIEPKSPVMDLE